MNSLSLLILICSHRFIASFINPAKIPSKFLFPVLKSLDDDVLELSEENAIEIIQEVRDELGTIFGYDPKSREVGITGQIDFVDLDGGVINVALSGKYSAIKLCTKSFFFSVIFRKILACYRHCNASGTKLYQTTNSGLVTQTHYFLFIVLSVSFIRMFRCSS